MTLGIDRRDIVNDTLLTIAKRASCRSYTGEAVERDKLELIGRAGLQSPSSMNSQNWEIIIISDKPLMDELNKSAMEHLRSEDEETYERISKKSGKLFYNAPAMALVLQVPSAHAEVALDCGIVVQSMAIAAQSLGVANVIARSSEFPFLGVRGAEHRGRIGWKDGYAFGAGILLGYPVTDHARPPHEIDLGKLHFV